MAKGTCCLQAGEYTAHTLCDAVGQLNDQLAQSWWVVCFGWHGVLWASCRARRSLLSSARQMHLGHAVQVVCMDWPPIGVCIITL